MKFFTFSESPSTTTAAADAIDAMMRSAMMDAAMSDASNNSTEAELQAWREVHHHLSKAVLVAKEAVAVAKAQRRYWCEELVANLTPEGKPINTSTWKKSTRKTAAKRKQAGTASSSKRRKSDASEAVATAHHGLEAFSAQAFGMPNTNEAPTNISQLLNNNNNGSVEQVPAMTPMQVAQSGTEAQGPIMTPMQVAQRGGKVFPPPGQFAGKVFVPSPMAPYATAQPGPMSVPNAQPLGAYASVLQGGDDSDTDSDED